MKSNQWFKRAKMYQEISHESITSKRYDFAYFSYQQAVERFLKVF